jgi:hypothetical protein
MAKVPTLGTHDSYQPKYFEALHNAWVKWAFSGHGHVSSNSTHRRTTTKESSGW